MRREETVSKHFLSFADTINDPLDRFRALLSLLTYSRLTQQTQYFEQIISHLLQAARAVDSINLAFSMLLNIVKEYQKIGQISKTTNLLIEALSLASRIQDTDLKNKALRDVARVYAELLNSEQALKIAQSIYSHHFRYEALIWVIKSYAQTRKFDQAIELAESIGVLRYQTEAFDLIALEYIASGHLEEALQFVDNKNIDVKQHTLLLKKIAEEYSKQNNYDEAIQIANMASNDSLKSSILNIITEEYVASGGLHEALELTQLISRKDFKENAVLSVIKGYSNVGCYTQALEIIQFLKQADFKALALEHIINSCVDKESVELCNNVLSQSYIVAQKIRVQEIQFSTLLQIIDSYLRIGFTDKATEILSILHQKHKKIQVAPDTKDFMLCHIGVRWARLEKFDKSFEIVKILNAYSEKSLILATIATQMLIMGQESSAESLFHEAFNFLHQEDTNKVESTLQQIIEELLYSKSYSKATEIAQLIISEFVTSNSDTGIPAICWLACALLKKIESIDESLAFLNRLLKELETKTDEIKTKFMEGILNLYERT